jgi:hypothetical protein
MGGYRDDAVMDAQLQAESDRLKRMVAAAATETRKLTQMSPPPVAYTSPASKTVSPYTLSDDYSREMARIKEDALNAGLEVRWISSSCASRASLSLNAALSPPLSLLALFHMPRHSPLLPLSCSPSLPAGVAITKHVQVAGYDGTAQRASAPQPRCASKSRSREPARKYDD